MDERLVASVEGEMASGKNDEQGRDVDGKINGNNVSSKQIEAARLAANNRYMCGNAT